MEPAQRGRSFPNERVCSAAERRVLSAIKTRPDGKWLASIADRGILPDGRCVILEPAEETEGNTSIHLYGADGEPLHTIALPPGSGSRRLSLGAHWIVVGNEGLRWTLVRLADETVFGFDSGLDDQERWQVGQTPDGKRLLLLSAQSLELLQYELP